MQNKLLATSFLLFNSCGGDWVWKNTRIWKDNDVVGSLMKFARGRAFDLLECLPPHKLFSNRCIKCTLTYIVSPVPFCYIAEKRAYEGSQIQFLDAIASPCNWCCGWASGPVSQSVIISDLQSISDCWQYYSTVSPVSDS